MLQYAKSFGSPSESVNDAVLGFRTAFAGQRAKKM